jgi:hypothetical protein
MQLQSRRTTLDTRQMWRLSTHRTCYLASMPSPLPLDVWRELLARLALWQSTNLPLGADATDHDSCTNFTTRPGMIPFTTQRIEAWE